MNVYYKYIVECLGTFALTLVVALSIAGKFPVPTPVLAALTLGLFVYTAGHLSQVHINPAVTIAVWSIKHISTRDAVGYIIAQFLGALAAMLLATLYDINGVASGIVAHNTLAAGFAEMLGTFFFAFGIASVIFQKSSPHFSGFVIGGSLLLGIAFSALLGANGVLNPAVATGIGSLSVAYVLGPILGSVLGMNAYRYLSL